MNKQDLLKLQTCVLRVNIDCDGCKQKVGKILQKIEGVYSTKIDAETGKVTVIGNVDPTKLVKKLENAGKHTEIWSFQKGPSNFQAQIDNSKVGQNENNNKNKAHNNGGKGQMGNCYKDPRAMAMAAPPKDKKFVKFNLPEEEFDGRDDEFDDDEFEDEYDDGSSYEDDDGGDDHEVHHGNHMPNKTIGIPMMEKHHGAHGPDGTINMHAMNDNKKRGVGSNKKGGVTDVPFETKGKTGKGQSKKGNNGGKKDSGGKGGRDGEKRGCQHGENCGKGKKEGKSGGGFLGFGLFGLGRNCKGGEVDNCTKKGKKGEGGKHENGPKKGVKKDGPIEFNPLGNGFHGGEHVAKAMKAKKGNGGAGKGNGGGGRKTGNANGQPNILGEMGHINGLPIPMGHINGLPIPMGPMGNVNGHMGQMGNIPGLQGLPAQTMMNGGYYQGVGPGNPYNQQQQYMAMMMMNQQRANGNDMYQPMMYGRPFPPANYSVMPSISPAPANNYAHFFSDENANSCSIM